MKEYMLLRLAKKVREQDGANAYWLNRKMLSNRIITLVCLNIQKNTPTKIYITI